MNADGPEQREANQIERQIQAGHDLDLGELLADEARDLEALTRPEINLAAQIDRLGATAITIKMQRDSLADTLRDIARGAQMLIDSGAWSGAALHYIQEVNRVARAGLKEALQ